MVANTKERRHVSFMSTVLDRSTDDAVVVADEDGKIIYADAKAKALFGYTEEEMLDKPISILMPERFTEKHRLGFEVYAKTSVPNLIGKTVDQLENEPLCGLRKDGKEFRLSISLSSWKENSQHFFGAVIREV